VYCSLEASRQIAAMLSGGQLNPKLETEIRVAYVKHYGGVPLDAK